MQALENQSQKNDFPDLDRFFMKSTNSPNYYVIHQKDLDVVKISFNNYKDYSDSLINVYQSNKKIIDDSLLTSKLELEKANAILNSKNITEQQKQQAILYKEVGTIGSIMILILISILLGSNYFKIKVKYRTDLESLQEIEKQYQVYKSNTVERERKYLREIIDLKNRLEVPKGKG
jgi:hypothetical protein